MEVPVRHLLQFLFWPASAEQLGEQERVRGGVTELSLHAKIKQTKSYSSRVLFKQLNSQNYTEQDFDSRWYSVRHVAHWDNIHQMRHIFALRTVNNSVYGKRWNCAPVQT